MKKVALLLSFGLIANVDAAISISETRIEFDERKRAHELVLMNRGSETEVYSLSLIEMTMDELGTVSELTEAYEQSAKKMIRYSPRRVTLEPGEKQKVRVFAKRLRDIKDGEYRSHLRFIGSKQNDNENSIESILGENEIRSNVTTRSAHIIPIIIREGVLSVSTSISDVFISNDNSMIDITMKRSGSRSAFNDISVSMYDKSEGGWKELSKLEGSAIYTTTSRRKLSMRLPNVEYKPEDKVRVIITDNNSGLLHDEKIFKLEELKNK